MSAVYAVLGGSVFLGSGIYAFWSGLPVLSSLLAAWISATIAALLLAELIARGSPR